MLYGRHVILADFKLTEYAEQLLLNHGYLYYVDSPRLEEILPNVDVVLCLALNVNSLRKMRGLRMIQSVSAGVDALPWREIPETVTVCSNAGSNHEAVAEHAWALILALAKNLHIHLPNIKEGVFDPSPGTKLLFGKKLGIIGMGTIGRRIAGIGKALDMKISAITKSGKTSIDCDFVGGPEALEKVLSEADVIVLSAPFTKYTRGMINLSRLRVMKRSSILVNITRPDIIKREDLLVFLKENPDFRVATDVWWNIGEKFRLESDLTEYRNFIGTPWVAGSGPLNIALANSEVWEMMMNEAAANIVRFLKGDKARNIVDRSDYL